MKIWGEGGGRDLPGLLPHPVPAPEGWGEEQAARKGLWADSADPHSAAPPVITGKPHTFRGELIRGEKVSKRHGGVPGSISPFQLEYKGPGDKGGGLGLPPALLGGAQDSPSGSPFPFRLPVPPAEPSTGFDRPAEHGTLLVSDLCLLWTADLETSDVDREEVTWIVASTFFKGDLNPDFYTSNTFQLVPAEVTDLPNPKEGGKRYLFNIPAQLPGLVLQPSSLEEQPFQLSLPDFWMISHGSQDRPTLTPMASQK